MLPSQQFTYRRASPHAIFEHWSDAGGGAGKSLFYHYPAASTWKQVWVGGYGRIKEKQVVDAGSPNAVRFQGGVGHQGFRTAVARL